MGTISSSVGLISGLDIQSLVTQLMAIESRPLQQLQARIAEAKTQQTAYMELNALFLSAKSAVHTLTSPSFFRTKTATSSNRMYSRFG
jgi:flagellar hook-associated protein 2